MKIFYINIVNGKGCKMESNEVPVRVLYIMGTARSGSTILDTVLGNNKNIESVGELINLPVNGWCNNEYCACGHRANNCPYWSAIQHEWMRSTKLSDFHEYINLQNKMAQLWKRFRTFRTPDCSSAEFLRFSELTLALYREIKAVSGKDVVVDSSKNPLRAYLLSMIPGIDLRVVHLIRDARGVAWSKKKAYKKNEKAGVQKDLKSNSIWYTAINWDRINLRCEWVRKKIDPKCSIKIRYEEFVMDPRKTLQRIGELINIDYSDVATNIEANKAMTVGHTVAGNKLRMSSNIQLKLDEEWKHGLSKLEKFIIWFITAGLLKRYKNES